MKSGKELRRFYDTVLRPVLEELEGRRKGICRKIIITAVVLVVLLLISVGLVAMLEAPAPFLVVGLVVAALILVFTWWMLTKDFVPEFKRRVIAEVVRFLDPNLRYASRECIPEHRFVASRIFLNRIDRYRGEDFVSGRIDATEIAFSELHAQYKTTHRDSKGRRKTRWHTIFKGLYFIADFNKHFHGLTVVLPDTAERLFGFLGKKLQEMNFARSGDLVKLEDPEFERMFVVYGDDQVEARYILSTALMRRIIEFRKKTGNTVFLSFVHSNVHVAISLNRDLFEPRIFSTLLDFGLIEEYLDDLELATGIVEDLNLNTRIWTKQ